MFKYQYRLLPVVRVCQAGKRFNLATHRRVLTVLCRVLLKIIRVSGCPGSVSAN